MPDDINILKFLFHKKFSLEYLCNIKKNTKKSCYFLPAQPPAQFPVPPVAQPPAQFPVPPVAQPPAQFPVPKQCAAVLPQL